MPQFDHITIIAPTLDEGIAFVGPLLGVDLINGATHLDMGTHNRRVKLGETCYLEVMAVNPEAPTPARPRWFGLDQIEAVRAAWSSGSRLRGWVARTSDIDAVLQSHGALLGAKHWLDDHFNFAILPNGELPLGGALPGLIDVGDSPPTATGLTDQGIRLKEFVLEHPDPPAITALYGQIGIVDAPAVVHGDRIALSVRLETPDGRTVMLR